MSDPNETTPSTPTEPTAPTPSPSVPRPKAQPKAPDKAALRGEFDGLHAAWAKAVTPASDDPKDTRKLGKPLTPDESKRLHELHSLIG
jgi:hypothetical protein